MIDVALQVVLVVLLLLTITWCVIVHLRLRRLRTDGNEMQAFVEALGEATARAEATIRMMRETGHELESKGLGRESQARERGSELGRLIEKATRVTRRLEAALEEGTGRVAELRTLDERGSEEHRRPPVPTPADRPPNGPKGAAGARPSTGGNGRPEKRLDGLLHGELLEALQALR